MPGSIKAPSGVFAAMARSRSPHRFQCEWEGCGKSCGRKTNLLRHVRAAHEGVQPYACDICQAVFGLKHNVDVHVRTVHEGLSPFQCEHAGCGKSVGQTHHLARHVRAVHEGLEPFACDVCQTWFGRNHDFAVHIRTVHEGLRPFACGLCDATFGRQHGLKVHIHQIHSTKALKRVKKRGEQTRNALSEHGLTYDREHRIKFSSRADRPCSARVDFAVLRSWGYVYLEVDERQHQGYPEGHDALRIQLILAEHRIEGKAGNTHRPVQP